MGKSFCMANIMHTSGYSRWHMLKVANWSLSILNKLPLSLGKQHDKTHHTAVKRQTGNFLHLPTTARTDGLKKPSGTLSNVYATNEALSLNCPEEVLSRINSSFLIIYDGISKFYQFSRWPRNYSL